jgi:hypothetical protein
VPRYQSDRALRPGRVAELLGVVFQSDAHSVVGRAFIRPVEALDRWIAGVLPEPGDPPLAMHAGLHIRLQDGRELVAEQLVGTVYLTFRNGLNWTPIDDFRRRDRGGWDLTVPAVCFRGVDERALAQAVANLNAIEGRPFVGEDCTAFIERAFGGPRLFADSPLLRALGFGVRVGDPALPLLRPDARLDERAEQLLHADALRRLPDALADPDSPNARLWLKRLALAGALGGAGGLLAHRARHSSFSRRSSPASSTARRFFR